MPGPENQKSPRQISAGYLPVGGRISSGFCPMRIELREAKNLPNNKDCLQNIFLIIIIKIIIIEVIILKKN